MKKYFRQKPADFSARHSLYLGECNTGPFSPIKSTTAQCHIPLMEDSTKFTQAVRHSIQAPNLSFTVPRPRFCYRASLANLVIAVDNQMWTNGRERTATVGIVFSQRLFNGLLCIITSVPASKGSKFNSLTIG